MAVGGFHNDIQSISGFEIRPLPSKVNHRQGGPNKELVLENPIRFLLPDISISPFLCLLGGQSLMGNTETSFPSGLACLWLTVHNSGWIWMLPTTICCQSKWRQTWWETSLSVPHQAPPSPSPKFLGHETISVTSAAAREGVHWGRTAQYEHSDLSTSFNRFCDGYMKWVQAPTILVLHPKRILEGMNSPLYIGIWDCLLFMQLYKT